MDAGDGRLSRLSARAINELDYEARPTALSSELVRDVGELDYEAHSTAHTDTGGAGAADMANVHLDRGLSNRPPRDAGSADQYKQFKALLGSRYPKGGTDLAEALGGMITMAGEQMVEKPVGTAARLSLLLRAESLEVLDRTRRNAFHMAAGFGRREDFDIVWRTLNTVPDEIRTSCLSAKDLRGWNVLHHAVERTTRTTTPAETCHILRSLLKAGAHAVLPTRDMNGYNAAHRACLQDKSAAAILLLREMSIQNRGLLDERTSESQGWRTCLHIAALYGLPDVATYLLKSRAKVDLGDSEGSTAWEVCTSPRRRNDNSTRLSSDYDAVTAFLAFRLETEAPPHWYRVLTRFSRGPRFREDKEESRLVDPQIVRFEIFPPSSPGPYILSANNYIWTLALVRWAIDQTSHKAVAAETAVTFVNESFRESGDLHNKLLYRDPAVLRGRSVASGPVLRLVSIVMPYFYSASWGYVRNRKLAPLASTVQWGGDKSPKEVHLPLTLDEYCNPWLTSKTLLGRNQVQVVWRYERERILRASPHPDPGFVLWEYNDDKELVFTKPQSESQGIVDTA
ncbi:hypothetical protein LTR91_003554 [Friedmanniomyces endolithicus]|uniref:Uncharacterized protein n=1 Tax=Friedmanniomyces endolithicus TaxID=329885 RepID=A0AAN6KX36_9PEZI|nr:hypothetical protein LTS01_007947 [Friedmanniomyces endolithicus]KAK1006945.1 hypothetical protein LTR91_003554 [Friedmanniomyces endolithicus]KAK1041211.1 hypothetical protein LTS16_009798 [Friedmanniomyces endolithicus]